MNKENELLNLVSQERVISILNGTDKALENEDIKRFVQEVEEYGPSNVSIRSLLKVLTVLVAEKELLLLGNTLTEEEVIKERKELEILNEQLYKAKRKVEPTEQELARIDSAIEKIKETAEITDTVVAGTKATEEVTSRQDAIHKLDTYATELKEKTKEILQILPVQEEILNWLVSQAENSGTEEERKNWDTEIQIKKSVVLRLKAILRENEERQTLREQAERFYKHEYQRLAVLDRYLNGPLNFKETAEWKESITNTILERNEHLRQD